MANVLRDIFSTKKMALIASLPGNCPELAKAAERGGADAVKVHLNVSHAASGLKFGSFEEERENLAAIMEAVSIPVGIMPGAGPVATLDEMKKMAEMGVGYYDIYINHMPAEWLTLEGMDAMPALGHGQPLNWAKALKKLKFKYLEASVVAQDQYGTPLLASDLAEYAVICHKFDGAVVAPTQKAIKPEEVGPLCRAGVRGLMIGAIVTGGKPETLEAAAAKYRKAIDSL